MDQLNKHPSLSHQVLPGHQKKNNFLEFSLQWLHRGSSPAPEQMTFSVAENGAWMGHFTQVKKIMADFLLFHWLIFVTNPNNDIGVLFLALIWFTGKAKETALSEVYPANAKFDFKHQSHHPTVPKTLSH